jgi:hypothetical protein
VELFELREFYGAYVVDLFIVWDDESGLLGGVWCIHLLET